MKNISNIPGGAVWIGLTDKETEGTFVWESGRQLSAEVAAHWNAGEPNDDNDAGDQDCVSMYSQMSDGMADRQCHNEMAYICQRRPGICNRCSYITCRQSPLLG